MQGTGGGYLYAYCNDQWKVIVNTGCSFPVTQGNNALQFPIQGLNLYTYPATPTVTVSWDVTLSASVTLLPGESQLTCPTAFCGKPINLLNGNTWITQHDYSLPGLGGGIALDRTWNSLWPKARNSLPLSGMFGDSWRSTYEEYVLVSGNFATYYTATGDNWSFIYSSASQAYIVFNPPDQHATIAFNSTTNQYLLTLKSGDTRVFSGAGNLVSLLDRNNNTTTLTYDTSNRITQVKDAANRTVTFNYGNPSFPNLVTTAQDATGTIATYTYLSSLLSNVTYPDGSQFNFTYGTNNLILSVTDAQSRVIESHTYDSNRRGLTSSRANGVDSVTVSYPAEGTTTVTDSASNTTTYGYTFAQAGRYVSAVAGPACASCYPQTTSSYGYDANGNRTSTVDGNGNTITYTTDANSNQTSMSTTLANGQIATWHWTYNNFAEVLTTTDPLGNVTTNFYDPKGNLLTTTTPSPDGGTTPASVTTFTYYANGTLKTIKDPLNDITTLTYYTTGLVNTVKDANNKVTTYTYDARGNVLSVQDPVNGATKLTTFTYDLMNRMTSTTYPGQTTPVQFHYDYRGRRDSVTDQNSNKTTYTYDDADRLVAVTDAQTPTPGATQYGYDNENNLRTITDALSHQTVFSYDPQRRLSQTQFPSLLVETYGYDNNNNLTLKTDRKNQPIHYSYDALNRLTTKTNPDQSSVNYTYDLNSRLTQVQDATGTYGFAYDNMNRLTQTTTAYTFLTARNFTVQYTYDAGSNRKTMTDPEQGAYQYTYDALNRLSNIQDFQQLNYGFTYDNLSRRKTLTRPNSITTSYSYDEISHLLSVLHKNSGGTTLDGATYTYDNAGNRLTRTDKQTGIKLTYTYDNIYQLQTAKQGSTTKESYTYDLVGNRLSSLGVSPYQYNASNWLTSIPGTTYNYDNNGSLTSKSDGTTYSWDYENRLTQVVLPGTGGTVTFKYDPMGRRIQKAFTQASTTTTTNYVYDGANAIEEVDANGAVLARYTQRLGIDEPLAELRSSTTSYYDADGLGSITSLSSSAGALANTYTYDSFGKLTASTGTITNPFQYTARELDSQTGIYEYRARYYDQSVGRFISEDPIQFKGGIDFYAYVMNSPTNRTDPTGLKDCDCTKAAPLPSSTPKCDDYGNEIYLGSSLRCFCKCAGDSAWSQQTRGCLACEHDNGTNAYIAHERCYRASGVWSAPWGTLSKCYVQCLAAHAGGK